MQILATKVILHISPNFSFVARSLKKIILFRLFRGNAEVFYIELRVVARKS